MEKITLEIVTKNKERFQRLKELRDNLEKPNIRSNLVTQHLKNLLDFSEVTAKEINVNKTFII